MVCPKNYYFFRDEIFIQREDLTIDFQIAIIERHLFISTHSIAPNSGILNNELY